MRCDYFRLSKKLHQLQRKPDEEKLARIKSEIESSIFKREQRQESIPEFNYPEQLPVSEKHDDIAEIIRKNQIVLLCGETGSGKTTQLPKICLQAGRGRDGIIGHTQPRRLAARAVSNRIAEELKTPLGDLVGFHTRFNQKLSERNLIKIMTDGILLAEIQQDRWLNKYDTIIIDEAHERSLNIDFLLGYLRWLLPQRRDLKLIITSATIDPERFSKHFNNAPIINVSGRTYPVEMRYRPIQQLEEDDETSVTLQQAILKAVDELHSEIWGDILIFLSGEHEIRETAASLRKHHPTHCQILPLYSKLSVSEQERVFKPSGSVRIVLATNVAETSLTVPSIRTVIDTGHARISRYSHRSKIQRLPIEKISQASANQRAGRCGRVANGICIRLYSHEDYLARSQFTEPEILRTNLSSVMLQMTALKLGEIEKFPFVEPPEVKMIRDAKTTLHEVNALDNKGKLTAMGRQLAKLPTDPKLARMLLAANQLNCLTEVTIIVSGLSIQDPREKPADKMQQAAQKQEIFKTDDSDFLSFFKLWTHFEDKKKHLSNNKLRKYCRDHFISYLRMREWHDIHTQIMQVIKGELKFKLNSNNADYASIHQALLSGLLSNIGFRHEQYQYLGARNLKFFIFPGSSQYKPKPKWIMAAEQVETSKIYARNVAKIEPQWIETAAKHLVKRSYYAPHWEKKAGRSAVYERILLYGLTLEIKRKIPYERIDPKAAREIFIRCGLVAQDYHTNAPFFKANQHLLEEVGMIQHKGRRVDLVEDEEGLYHFYNEKLPETIVSGIALDQWRKQVERQTPEILFLSKADLTREQEGIINEWDFPNYKSVGRLTIELSYRFEPGHDEDGVTAIIPMHQLNQLNPLVFAWLVPGLLEEKVIALIKSLPKQLRKHFVPVPETAKACLAIEPDFKGSLYEWLSMRLRKLTGEAIPLTEWRLGLLSDHLQMNYRVVDETGKALAYGRDLKKLQARYAKTAGMSFDELAADELNYTGYSQWAFDDLPETYQFSQNNQAFIGFPGLVDEGDTIGVKIFDTLDKAQLQHELGLVRLFQLQCRKECQYILKGLNKETQAALIYNQLLPHPLLKQRESVSYKEDMLHLILYQVFVENKTIRSQTDFETVLQQNKPQLILMSHKISLLLVEIMKTYHDLVRQFALKTALATLVIEIQTQLQHLFYQGFIRYIPYQQLQHLPRYLTAMTYRLDKRDLNPSKSQALKRYWCRFWQEIQKQVERENVYPERDPFRWLLEEFSVSLYAQQLKTPIPISVKRLEKAWDNR
jgi:ATP-dependent helicase HrpA